MRADIREWKRCKLLGVLGFGFSLQGVYGDMGKVEITISGLGYRFGLGLGLYEFRAG